MVTEADRTETPYPPRRIVMLGASNLIRGISTVVEIASRAWGRPLDVIAALGHGRSYGLDSHVCGRALPGIVSCGLWTDLELRPPAETLTLITDVGNDLLYGASPDQLAGWVETSLQRLRPQSEKIVITELPLESLAGLGSRRFVLLRSILFPRSRLQLKEAIRRATCVNEMLIELALRYQAHLVKPDPDWFGFDPIHIKMRHWGRAWEKIFEKTAVHDLSSHEAGSLGRWLQLRSTSPHYRRLFGIEQRRVQPALILRDGTKVSFY